MYTPRHFLSSDEDRLFQFIDQAAVASLITAGPAGLVCNQVPLLRQPACAATTGNSRGRLWGHLARPNPQLEELAAVDEVLVNFAGPSAYVSPNWYADPGLVPTWNFVTVQVRGRPVLHDDPEAVLDIVQRLSARHEAAFDAPWTTHKMEPRKLQKMLQVIVGFHIEIEQVQGKFKLSQNRSETDRAGVIDGLETAGHQQLAAMMRAAQPGEK